jgi:hypothetical protein
MSLNRFLLGLAASVLLSLPAGADAPAAMNSPAVNSPAVISPLMSATRPHAPSVVKIANKSSAGLETYRDLIQKAQNLTLQRDRLQTSQILLRGLQRETKGSVAYRELARALNELTTVFYTEKAQTYFVSGESLMMAHPHDATAPLQEALKLEEGNVAVLRALARAHLMAS